MDTTTRTVIVARKDEGSRLANYLAARFTYQSEAEWERHVAEGRIALNGAPCPPDVAVRAGDRVSFTPPHLEEPPINADYSILLEDDRFIFVDKPPLLPAHPAGIYRNNTLLSLLRERYGDIRLVNRLDRETSGVIIAARTQEAAALAAELMQGRLVEKEYRALVEGDFSGRVDAAGYLVRDDRSPIRKKLRFEPFDGTDRGIFAETSFEPMGAWAPGISLVRARPVTGRTHQIRATLEALGHPIVGDKLYGADPTAFLRFIAGELTDADRARLILPHQALHCARISFSLADGARYDVTAPTPASWRACAENRYSR